MINLTEEQLRKIEENKAAAILKKEQAIQRLKNPSTSYNLNSTESNATGKYFGNHFRKSPVKVDFKNKHSTATISAVCKVHGEGRFLIDMPYHATSIEMFKTVNGRKYETDLKKWSFPLTEHSTVVSKLKNISADIVVNAIPDSIVRILLQTEPSEPVPMQWSKIDKTLREFLMPFQVEGVKFGVDKRGRCLIADDMGLGKTIQALGIAHYFKENWPLLIVCPSSMRFPWLEAIKTFLPSVKAEVQVLTSGKGQTIDGDIVIVSYDLMKNCFEDLTKQKFGAIIFDESHLLKSSKSIRTTIALQLASTAKNVILLSGTPALSRPQELYSQIFAIDPFTFKKFYEFGMRYCDGKKDKFGWNFSGSSNLEELELYLRKKIMIRRLKSEVIKQLPSKIRKIVILHPNMVKTVMKQIKQLESEYVNQKGAEKQSTLLTYYALTGKAKLNAVCEYIEDKLENNNKFLIFAHHTDVMNGICDLLCKKKVDYIRIDGSVGSEMRKNLCDKFQSQESCRVAVLSIKAASCGITLTAAQLVIFAELYWNPGELTQAEDRAHRIGQQDIVVVEYLIAKGTADDHIWQLIEYKLNILNKVGLSKESFKNSDTQHLNDRHQPEITSMLQASDNTHNNPFQPEVTSMLPASDDTQHLNDPHQHQLNSVLQVSDVNVKKEIINLEDDFLLEGEDDIFSNINLEEIENEYQMNTKKRRTDI